MNLTLTKVNLKLSVRALENYSSPTQQVRVIDSSGQTRELTGKQSMQEGMMDGDGWVAPTDGNGMSTSEHWDECPSVLELWWNVRVMGVGATRQGRREN